jgi:hypothetical protein
VDKHSQKPRTADIKPPQQYSRCACLAILFDNLWLLIILVPLAFVIRYGVVAREEAYLERKFVATARAYDAGCNAQPLCMAKGEVRREFSLPVRTVGSFHCVELARQDTRGAAGKIMNASSKLQ